MSPILNFSLFASIRIFTAMSIACVCYPAELLWPWLLASADNGTTNYFSVSSDFFALLVTYSPIYITPLCGPADISTVFLLTFWLLIPSSWITRPRPLEPKINKIMEFTLIQLIDLLYLWIILLNWCICRIYSLVFLLCFDRCPLLLWYFDTLPRFLQILSWRFKGERIIVRLAATAIGVTHLL